MTAAVQEPLIGVINAGSSSVKFSVYESERRILTGGRWNRRSSVGERGRTRWPSH